MAHDVSSLSMDELDATIAALLKHGPDLRRAGYQSVTIGEVSFTLHPPEPNYDGAQAPKPEQTVDAMNNPATYGLPEGSKLPGFTDPRAKKGQP